MSGDIASEKESLERQLLRLKAVNSMIKDLEESLECLKKERTSLKGDHSFMPGGSIRKTRASIAKLELKLLHESKPVVIWSGEASGIPKGEVVSKVTEKRIWVCSPGSTQLTAYHKDGKPVSSYLNMTIDIEATFGGPCPKRIDEGERWLATSRSK